MYLDAEETIKGSHIPRLLNALKDPEIRRTWLDSLPNDRRSLETLKEIWEWRKHFVCEFTKSQGGSRPTHPLFDGIPNTCLKQTPTILRNTNLSSAEKRRENQVIIDSKRDSTSF